MRRLVALGIVVLLAVSLAGCGGGADEPAATSGDAVQTQAPADTGSSTTAAGDVVSTADVLSPQPEQVFEPFPADEEILPSAIADRLDSGQPIMVLFYDSSQEASDDQREAVDAVVADYRGLIDLVAYDIGAYVETNEDGSIDIDTSLIDDDNAARVAGLASENYLNVRYTPYIVLVDSQGYITHRFQGYVDDKTLEREVLRATE